MVLLILPGTLERKIYVNNATKRVIFLTVCLDIGNGFYGSTHRAVKCVHMWRIGMSFRLGDGVVMLYYGIRYTLHIFQVGVKNRSSLPHFSIVFRYC
jgi:hypothetical protein